MEKQENKKYYTPEIEEFHVGFEYKLKGERIKRIFGTNCTVDTELAEVKYLDQEDIESFGFEFKQGTMYDTRDLYFTNDKCHITLQFQTGKCIIEHNFKDWFYENPEILFKGYIKNKSELKRLLKQLNIL